MQGRQRDRRAERRAEEITPRKAEVVQQCDQVSDEMPVPVAADPCPVAAAVRKLVTDAGEVPPQRLHHEHERLRPIGQPVDENQRRPLTPDEVARPVPPGVADAEPRFRLPGLQRMGERHGRRRFHVQTAVILTNADRTRRLMTGFAAIDAHA